MSATTSYHKPPTSFAAAMAHSTAVIPADMLYWGRLPATSNHLSTQALRYRFERLLPMPVETLHTVHTTLPSGDVLIIGIEPARLRTFLADIPGLAPSLWSLVPADVPTHLAASDIGALPLQRLNLLAGAFEPAPRRRLRLLGAGIVHGGLAVTLAIILFGIERHATAIDAHAVAQQKSVQELLDQVLPPQRGVALPGTLRLTMELRTLELAAHSPMASTIDVAAVLDRLWAEWPTGLRMQAEIVTATSERIVVRGTVASLGEAERLAKACANLSASGLHYRAEPLQAQSGEHGTTVLITLVRLAGTRP